MGKDETQAGSELSGGFGALSRAAQDVMAERQRQVAIEGWTPEHDDHHMDGELEQAAACYAYKATAMAKLTPPSFWPWDEVWWKPDAHRRMLVKAGALILAAIERLDRRA